ncbi:SDR family oxidoreductase [Bifidobacterium aquikefiri]|uniref:SDR family oxidoreductase n=1 Tax=Bifidobacterium aquikefiri TaxID=1653207 RepID=UPI0039EA27A2
MTGTNTNENAQSTNKTGEQLSKQEFPQQTQNAPGTTTAMTPEPDHGEFSWKGLKRLAGKRALITGGDSGIGRATAIAFAREGAHVAISYLSSEIEDAQRTQEIIDIDGKGGCEIFETDIRDEARARKLVDDAAEALGGLDILVNDAGTQQGRRPRGFTDLKGDDMRNIFSTNLLGTFYVTQQALTYLHAGSSIINVTSIQAYNPSANLIDYAATKAALTNFTANLAQQLGPRGIRVNAVAPGPIWTPLITSTMPQESIENFGRHTPLGRAGQPSELAGAMVFLANNAEASYVSGTVLAVTGGEPIF